MSLTCNKINHQGEQIRALCLRKDCNYQSTTCYLCSLEDHQNCAKSTKLLKDLPQLLLLFQNIKSAVISLQQKIMQQMQNLIDQIDQLLKPINSYQEIPNVSNLNELGAFLKKSDSIEMEIDILFEQCQDRITSYFKSQYNQPIDLKQQLKTKEGFYNEGQELNNLNKCQTSIECYEQTLKIDPKYINAWYHKGVELFRLNKYQEAVECYEQALKIDSNYVKAWNGKGNALNNLNQYKAAIKCYEQALEIDPKCVNAQNGKGDALNNLKQYKAAIQCYDQALQMDPKYIKALNGKGVALNNLKQYNAVIECYEQALQIDPNHTFAIKDLQYELNYISKRSFYN